MLILLLIQHSRIKVGYSPNNLGEFCTAITSRREQKNGPSCT